MYNPINKATGMARCRLLSFLFGLCLAGVVILAGLPAAGQMPDWRMINDRDGNRYYFDQNGKIYTSGVPEFSWKEVSAEGIDYYYHQGVELVKSHYKVEGLVLLKSVMALSPENGRVSRVQRDASLFINEMIRREGGRYRELNEKASLLLVREGEKGVVVDDRMRFRFSVDGSVRVINRRMKSISGYDYGGLLVGVNFTDVVKSSVPRKEGYDLLVAVDSERFSEPIRTVSALERNWRNNLGADTFERTLKEKAAMKVVYALIDAKGPYAGVEGFFVRDRYGHCVRMLCTKELFVRNRARIENMISAFEVSL
jgi:hypothetical protein